MGIVIAVIRGEYLISDLTDISFLSFVVGMEGGHVAVQKEQ